MGRSFRGNRRSNGYDGSRQHKKHCGEYREQTGEISTYCTLNLQTGEVYNCNSLSHACKSGFGNNKRTGTQNWLVIYRDTDCFICL